MNPQYSEDLFDDTRMPFGEHIEELRVHLWRALKWFFFAMCISVWPISEYAFKFITKPVEEALVCFHDKRELERVDAVTNGKGSDEQKALNEPKNVTLMLTPEEWKALHPNQELPATQGGYVDWNTKIRNPVQFVTRELAPIFKAVRPRPTLKSMSAQEVFMVYFKIVIICAFVIASPLIFIEIWSFVASGLYPHEKKWVYTYMPLTIFLFLAGVALCELFVIPAALDALLWFNEWLEIEPDLRLNEWLTMAILLPLIFGLAFQLPVVMLFLEKIGVFTPDDYASKRKIAYFIMLIISALGPTIDIFSMLLLWIPLCFLYEFGIIMARRSASNRGLEDVEVPYDPNDPNTFGSPPPPENREERPPD